MTRATELRSKAEHLHEVADQRVRLDQADVLHELAQRWEQLADAEDEIHGEARTKLKTP